MMPVFTHIGLWRREGLNGPWFCAFRFMIHMTSGRFGPSMKLQMLKRVERRYIYRPLLHFVFRGRPPIEVIFDLDHQSLHFPLCYSSIPTPHNVFPILVSLLPSLPIPRHAPFPHQNLHVPNRHRHRQQYRSRSRSCKAHHPAQCRESNSGCAQHGQG